MTPTRSEIAKQLGLSPSGLDYLQKRMRSRSRNGGSVAEALRSSGHLDECNNITTFGRRTVERALKMGWGQ